LLRENNDQHHPSKLVAYILFCNFLMLSTISTLSVEVTIKVDTRRSPTFNSLVVLNSFHPFLVFNILGDPLIFLPLVTHTPVCLTSLCFPHIVTSMPILPPCFIRNLSATRLAKNKKWFRVKQCSIFKLVSM